MSERLNKNYEKMDYKKGYNAWASLSEMPTFNGLDQDDEFRFAEDGEEEENNIFNVKSASARDEEENGDLSDGSEDAQRMNAIKNDEGRSVFDLNDAIRQIRERGYTPKRFGDCTVFGVNRDGYEGFISAYEDLWSDIAKVNPDFYENSRNKELSMALWNIGNAAMYDDIDRSGEEFSMQLFRKCEELMIVMDAVKDDPEACAEAQKYLGRLGELGESGEKVVAMIETLEGTATIGGLKKSIEAVKAKEAAIGENDIMKTIDSDDLEENIAG